MTFESKVDLWFLFLFYGGAVGMMVTGALVKSTLQRSLAGFVAAICLFVGLTVPRVHYTITEDGMLESRGLWGGGVIGAVDALVSITPSNDMRASEGASIDRLRVEHEDGTLTFIAVKDKSGFLDAVVAASTRLERSGDRVGRR